MEDSSPSPPSHHQGTLHTIPSNLSTFEPTKPLARILSINTLLWIGGMFDTPGSVTYPFTLAPSLPLTWSLMTATLSSTGFGWGVKSIATDAQDIARIVAYIKRMRPGGKVVLMGHSTGCQDCMEYVVGGKKAGDGDRERDEVNGVILQAPCSDRESMEGSMPAAFKHEADQLALKMCREGKDKDAMPNRLTKSEFGRMAITARRWLDVSSPAPNHDGADDYFSSDLGRDRLRGTFGRLGRGTPLLVLVSGSDEYMPKKVDKEALVRAWTDVVKEGGGVVDEEGSGVVTNASHGLNGDADEVVQDLVKRVVGFVGKLDEGVFEGKSARI